MKMPIITNGPVTQGTKNNLIEGIWSSPMSEQAVDAALEQSEYIAGKLVDIYSARVAENEVGEHGTGVATDTPILAEFPPRALLYGLVQSGKTVSMILTAALCLDNGFGVVVVLTTDNLALVRQTAARFRNLAGLRVLTGIKEGSSYDWQGIEGDVRNDLAHEGLILVCPKNARNLPEVIRFLDVVGSASRPAIVFDDEADAATPDTTLLARTDDRQNPPTGPSRMHRLVLGNEGMDEIGFSLCQKMPHSLYVGVTATPYVLFLQGEESPTRPSDTFLLQPGEGYCGGEVFFGAVDAGDPDAAAPTTLCFVDENESVALQEGIPDGLTRSINFVLIAASARSTGGRWPAGGWKHLSHTSPRTVDHELVSGYIEAHLSSIKRMFRGGAQAGTPFFVQAYEELGRSVADLPALTELLPNIREAARHANVIVVNSNSPPVQYGPRINFVVGGNILGRGITFDNLLVTYYVREAKVSQMDTVWQHARMFGYRVSDLPYTRVFLPWGLARRFLEIHRAEVALRANLDANANPKVVLLRVPRASRATRPNALAAESIGVVVAGRAQIAPQRSQADPIAAERFLSLLRQSGVTSTDGMTPAERPTEVTFQQAMSLIKEVPTDPEDPEPWDAELVEALLREFNRDATNVIVYVRVANQAVERARTRLSGPEVRLLRDRSRHQPSLALLCTGTLENPTGWYPTLVMPSDSPTFVYNDAIEDARE